MSSMHERERDEDRFDPPMDPPPLPVDPPDPHGSSGSGRD